MRRTAIERAIFALVISATWVSVAQARSFRVSQIPNGSVNGCANCHINPAGGGPRNPFGITVETSFLSTPGASGNVQWGPALAAIDSDGDGRSNGQELIDPSGAWTIGQPNPGSPTNVRLPGAADAAPVPALPLFGAVLAGLSLAGVGMKTLRRVAPRTPRGA